MLVVGRMRNGGSCSRRRRHDSDWIAAIVSCELTAECRDSDGGVGVRSGKLKMRCVFVSDVTWGSDQTQTSLTSNPRQVKSGRRADFRLGRLDGLGGLGLGGPRVFGCLAVVSSMGREVRL